LRSLHSVTSCGNTTSIHVIRKRKRNSVWPTFTSHLLLWCVLFPSSLLLTIINNNLYQVTEKVNIIDAMDENQKKDWLASFLWVLRNCERRTLHRWWRKIPTLMLQSFFR